MKVVFVKLKNFRSYKDEIKVDLEDLTAFVGKNDIGKSTILEALDIFFNEGKGVVKIDKEDLNKDASSEKDTNITISVGFKDLPESLILDTNNTTNLADEFLLSSSGVLEIVKTYQNGSSNVKTCIKAEHPSNENCKDLLSKKDSDLRAIIEKEGITCVDKKKKAMMRSAIWEHYDKEEGLELKETLIDISKKDKDKDKNEANSIWEKLQKELPLYSLFQADRKNSDGDSEIQDPLKLAVREILNDSKIQTSFKEIAEEVEKKLKEVSQCTLKKLREIDENIASTLDPKIPSLDQLKWQDVFKNVSIAGDSEIPINKRGSGIKRLILLSFFQAEVERRMEDNNCPSVIYAIEEPETSQHSENQKLLINAFLGLSQAKNTQVLLTTHSAQVVKQLTYKHIILICKNGENKEIKSIIEGELPYPSLNEVNYMAFNELSEEYHNELYGHLEEIKMFQAFRDSEKHSKRNYCWPKQKNRNDSSLILTEYIRHQIHHPENTLNIRFTEEELKRSIESMRAYIKKNCKK